MNEVLKVFKKPDSYLDTGVTYPRGRRRHDVNTSIDTNAHEILIVDRICDLMWCA